VISNFLFTYTFVTQRQHLDVANRR